jgi:hypothetical protein
MTAERCERCDREECEVSYATARHADVCGGPLEVVLDAHARQARAERDCAARAIDWRTRARDAEALLTVLADEFDRAARDKLDRGGQHVSYHGDFANIGHGAALKMRRWAKEIREAIKGET